MQRSIWISHEDWELIRTHAALAKESLSKYLLNLHKMNITSRGIVPPAVFVDSEELDRNPVNYREGTIGIVPEGHSSIIKKPVGLLPEAPVSRQDVINGVADGVLVPGPKAESAGTGGFFNPQPKDQDGKKKK